MVRPFLPHIITTDSAIGGSKIERSLRFRHGRSICLMTRTSESGSSTYTFSCWVKHTKLDDYKYIFSTGSAGLAFNGTTGQTANKLYIYDGSSLTNSSSYLRDTNSWYHIVMKMVSGTVYTYINGAVAHNGIGGFSLNTGGNSTRIGDYTTDHEFEGYVADVHLVDGLALDPTSFAYTESQTGLWMPKKYISPSVDHFNWALNNNITDALNGTAFTENGGSSSFVSAGSNSFGLTNCLDISGGKYLSYAIAPASQWTIDFYVKLDNFTGANSYIGGWNGTGGSSCCVGVNKDNAPNYYFVVWGGSGNLYQTGVTVSLNTWYHIRITSNATNNLRLYIDGTLRATDTSSNQNPATPLTFGDMQSGRFDGQIAGVRYVTRDLGAPPSGGLVSTNGVLPNVDSLIKYGESGFHLEFKDTSSTAAFGKDTSGNGNDFTSTNFHVGDNVPDSPTNNFALMSRSNGMTGIREAGLKFQVFNDSGGAQVACQSDMLIPKTGTWYWEVRWTGQSRTRYWGITRRLNNYTGVYYHNSGGVYYEMYNGTAHRLTGGNNTQVFSGGFTGYNDGVTRILGMTVNMDQMIAKYYMNSSFVCSVSIPELPNDGLSDQYAFSWVSTNGGSSSSENDIFNFGQDSSFIGYHTRQNNTDANGIGDFYYTPPDNALALCSQNTPPNLTSTKSIIRPQRHFDTLLWTGDDHNYRNIHGLDFTPDFVWIKNRSATDWHILQNSINGFQSMQYSNTSDGLNTDLNTNGYVNRPIRGEHGQGGFSVNAQGSGNVNEDSENYVAWCWKGGSPLTAPTSGSVFFSADNNYLDLGTYTDFQFGTGDYTIEMFVYHVTLSGQQTYVGDNYGNSAGVYFYKNSSNRLGMYYSSDIAVSSSTDIPLMKWVHIAASRSNGTLRLYQDGVEVSSASDSTNLTETQLNIGDTTGGSSGSMHGFISNVRVLKGTGLYTSNFTPPTSPLTNISNTVFLGCQSETVAGLASVHPSPFSNNGTNYSSGSQMTGDIAADGATGGGGKDSLFDGKIGQYNSNTYVASSSSANTNMTWTPTSSISYSSKVEVWCYSPNGYGITVYYTLNGGSEQTMPVGGGSNFNNQNWITLATGSGTITSINMRIIRPGSSTTINWGAIRIDGSILVNDVTGKVVTPTMDDTRSVPASPKNPFDVFAVDGTAYQTATAAGFTQGTVPVDAASVNTEGGFSCITYTGTGSAGTIGHGLGKAPQFIITKRTNTSQAWFVHHVSLSNGHYIRLNGTNAQGGDTNVYPNNMSTTNTFAVGGDDGVNGNGSTYVSYCWTEIPGYSKFGVYQGNGQDGNNSFVDCGFEPACVIFKRTNATDDWGIFDNKRVDSDPPNPIRRFLYPNANYAEWTGGTNDHMDFYSTGFKVQNVGTMIGASGGQYVYMAFASKLGDNVFDTVTDAN